MNHANMEALITTIKNAADLDKFDITHFVHNCGSPACVAGWALFLNTSKERYDQVSSCLVPNVNGIHDENKYLSGLDVMVKNLSEYIGVTREQAYEISTGFSDIIDDSLINSETTIAFLENIRINPDLTWFIFFEDYTPEGDQ